MSFHYFGDSYNKLHHKCDKTEGDRCPGDYDEIVTTKEAETIDAFSSKVIHMKKKTAHQGEGINMMTQALCVEDGSLPQGLMVQNAYMELCSGSKNITVVVRNSTAYPQSLRKMTPVTRAVTVYLDTRTYLY